MNIHVAALRRLLVGWLIIAAVVGGAGYWLGLGQISKQLTSLAQNEVNRLTPLIVKRINGNRVQMDASRIAFSLVTVTVSSLLIDAIKEWNGGGGG